MVDCVFCKIISHKLPAEVVAESNSFIAIKTIDPVTEGHTLVIPKKHYATLLDMPNNLGEEMLKFCKQVSGHLMDEKKGDGFNIIMNNLEVAGQEIMHAHWHIIPRNEDDKIRFFVKK